MDSPHHLRSSLCRMVAGLMLSAVPALGNAEPAWDAAAAAQYLETRLQWWRDWDRSGRDHGTKCVSCHTTLPYTLGMAALRSGAGLGSKAVPVAELAMLDDVVKRVYLWNEVEPFYPDQTRGIPKSSESRGVESVLNALILATRDAERGYLGADTRLAFGHMWNQQMKAGALLALALQEAGGPQAAAAVARARVWLGTYQDRSSGEVPALSINKERTPDAVAYWFMRDVATGLALLLMPAQNQFGQQDG